MDYVQSEQGNLSNKVEWKVGTAHRSRTGIPHLFETLGFPALGNLIKSTCNMVSNSMPRGSPSV